MIKDKRERGSEITYSGENCGSNPSTSVLGHQENTVRIVLPIFKPDHYFLRRQLKSIRDQKQVRVVLHIVIADMISTQKTVDLIHELNLQADIITPTSKLNSFDAFEFGLQEALKASQKDELFALCDQDDIWDDDKLSVSRRLLLSSKNTTLVHTDARVIDENNNILDQSVFHLEKRKKESNLRELLYLNNITGMTILARKSVIQDALPFPKQSGIFFHHDLWIGLVAHAKGQVLFHSGSTVSYRQHNGNAVGVDYLHRKKHESLKDWLVAKFAEYHLASYLAKSLFLRAEELLKTDPASIERKKLAQLKPYLSHYGIGLMFLWDFAKLTSNLHLKLASFAIERAVIKTGKLIWSTRKALKVDLFSRLREIEDIGYSVAPGVSPSYGTKHLESETVNKGNSLSWETFTDPRKKPSFRISVNPDAESGFTILVPTLNPSEIFAGIETALDLGVFLAQKGRKVQFISTDLPMHSHSASWSYIQSKILPDYYEALTNVTISCGKSSKTIEISEYEEVLATAWWTASIADKIIKNPKMKKSSFYYLIQDYEPNFYPWGVEYASALESYSYSYLPIFNTSILRHFFVSTGLMDSDRNCLVFRPSIDIERYSSTIRPAHTGKKRIAIYGRPEVSRNMFPLCLETLSKFILENDIKPDNVEFVSVGLPHDDICLPNGNILISMGKIPMSEYPVFLSTIDVALCLMLSPHPSHPPIEWAASGVRVVTNRYSVKDISQLSNAIYSGNPNAEDLSKCLFRAWVDSDEPVRSRDRNVDISQLGISLEEVADAIIPSVERLKKTS